MPSKTLVRGAIWGARKAPKLSKNDPRLHGPIFEGKRHNSSNDPSRSLVRMTSRDSRGAAKHQDPAVRVAGYSAVCSSVCRLSVPPPGCPLAEFHPWHWPGGVKTSLEAGGPALTRVATVQRGATPHAPGWRRSLLSRPPQLGMFGLAHTSQQAVSPCATERRPAERLHHASLRNQCAPHTRQGFVRLPLI